MILWFGVLVGGPLNALQADFPAGAKVLATNLRGFGVPFRIDSSDALFIEVQLYLSEDQGKTWRFYDRKTTDQTEFPFQADRDGEYWFALKTLDRNRRLIPEGKTQPELIILVDTVQPELSFQIESDPAGRVACRWRATDEHLDTSTFQIYYQAVGDKSDRWSQVPVDLAGTVRNGLYADQVAWWPETTAQSLNVRLEIKDTAGNVVQSKRRINVQPSPWRHRPTSTARVGDEASAGQHVCENGVCQLKPSLPAKSTTDPFPQPDMPPPQRAVEKQIAATSNSPGSPPSSRKMPIPRVANANGDLPWATNLPLIGGPPEFVAPPVPEGYSAPPRQTEDQVAASQASSGSVVWTSEPERWTTRDQTNSSTTRRPDRQVLPTQVLQNSYDENQDRQNRKQLPAPNPASMTTLGDRVIGESSTMGPHNQYRGLKPQNEFANQELVARPNPFLPGQPLITQIEDPRESGSVNELLQPEQQNWQTGYGHRESDSSGLDFQKGSNVDPDSRENETTNARAISPPSVLTNGSVDNDFDPAIQMIGSRRFRLNYGIDAIDPSGVARVDLWMTRDGGRSWNSWGTDPDNASPFPVELQEEGRFGFRIVVHSKDGLTGRGPSSGDAPDLQVQIDTQSPLAQIVSVPYGRGAEAGRLVINYRVADPFLILRPVTLAYSRNPSGPWTAIEEGLRNEGRYLWKPTADVPDRIFLRLDARDRAGNIGVHQLSQAIDVSGLVPRGTIHGVTPVGR